MADGYRFRMMGFPADLPLQPLGVDVSTAQRQTFIKDAAIDGTEPILWKNTVLLAQKVVS